MTCLPPTLGALAMLWCGSVTRMSAAEPAAAARLEFTLSAAFAKSLFATINRNDSLAAARIMGETIARRDGYKPHVTVSVYQDLDDLRRGLARGTIDMVIAGSRDYLELAATGAPADPVALPTLKDEGSRRYVLLAPRRQPALQFPDLRGKRVLIMRAFGSDLGEPWSDVVLAEKGLGAASEFFSSVKFVTSPSATVLPVFFGQADACVVSLSAFEVMTELNPQLSTKLTVVARSEPLVEYVVCLRRDYGGLRDWVVKRLLDLHQEPAGRQVLTIFKLDHLQAYDPKRLDSLRELCARYEALRKAKVIAPQPAATAQERNADAPQ